MCYFSSRKISNVLERMLIMSEKFYYHYCYSCNKITVFSNVLKNGEHAGGEHCTVCGIFKWYNDGELKERYFKNK